MRFARGWLLHSFALKIVTPVLGGAVAISVAVAGLLLWSSWEADSVARERQKRLAMVVISDLKTSIAYDQESVTVWDDSVRAVRQGDSAADWLDHNLGSWMSTYFGHDAAYVVDPENEPIYAFSGGKAGADEDFRRLESTIVPLIAFLREEMRTGRNQEPAGRMLTPGAADLMVVSGHPAVVSVKPIVSDTGEIVQTPGEEYLHIAVRYLDDSLLEGLRHDYLFDGIRFAWQDDSGKGETGLPLLSDSGAVIGYFIWQPHRPGTTVLANLAPVLLGVMLLALLTISGLLFLVNQRSKRLAASEARMQYLALHDPLTALPNRSLLEERLEEALDALENTRDMLAVLYLDLDRFKQVNDSLGHPAGDHLIKEVARRLGKLTRHGDTVARIGGDEFVVLMPHRREAGEVDAFCERVIEAMRQPYHIDGNQVFASISLGVAVAPVDGIDRAELTRKADIALYHAKSSGRSRYARFGSEMDSMLKERREIERDLRVALARRNELAVHYQPLYTARDMQITGVEALLRWRHPQKGWVSPALFVPIAEETGLIEALGDFVLREACLAALAWPDLTIAVNVSAIELRNPAFAGKVADALAEHGLEPGRLELEVTETALTDHIGECEGNVRALREMGVRIALDDFGTGFSSLGRLHQLKVDRIKIDRSFVSGFGKSSGDEAIIQAIVDLAHANGLRTTAEGVETSEQGDYLKTIGCDELQGFLLSRAVPPEEIDGLLGAKRRRSVASAA
ncbi:bifunctional diguanylate cyclase/phosphodiesterase [Chelativorans sp. AA-79]|uniref:putative bifunctional diguanylate cyclase/phosphodiesterase n=1 Tax=Chelativorans sp. AA-79 TaxID=3028735 RepID=UPI0023F88E9A|nr:bifunctional diguanylate cyclase/phosphodiesterase [Chelativorans sp. AA-79]WEX11672.1 bifunctional diguanylate cyclase/phosphodiesterase [Chelativorans sp. AA-79]